MQSFSRQYLQKDSQNTKYLLEKTINWAIYLKNFK